MSTFFWTIPTINVKNLNKHVIIDLVRFTPGGISRIELARKLSLTRAAVTTIVNDLQIMGILQEEENRPSNTKRAIDLEINPALGLVAGIDIGATHVMILIADFSAKVIAEYEFPMDIQNGPDDCLRMIAQKLREVLDANSITVAQLKAVVVGVPGPIVQETGVVGAPPIMPGWDRFPIRDYLQKRWGCPVAVGNDAELGALGEWAYGAGRGEKNLAYIKVGTGIGSGLLMDGQIYRGTTGSAGEIGHITINENGPLCSCGNRGCLEAFAGGRAISLRAADAIRKGQKTDLAVIKDLDKITLQDVVAAARHGDLLSQQIFMEAGGHLGTAIAGLVNLFNPGMVILGGGVSQIGDLLLEPIRKTVHQRSLQVASNAVRITTALLGRRSSAMGAVVEAISIGLHQMVDR